MTMKEKEENVLYKNGKAIGEWIVKGLSVEGSIDEDFDNYFLHNKQELFDLLEETNATKFMQSNKEHVDASIGVLEAKDATDRQKAQVALASVLEMTNRSKMPIYVQMCLGMSIFAHFAKKL